MMHPIFALILLLIFPLHTLANPFYLDLRHYKANALRLKGVYFDAPKVGISEIINVQSAWSNNRTISPSKPNLRTYSIAQLKTYFANNNYAEKDILSQHTLYMSNAFVQLAKTLPGYEHMVTALYHQFNDSDFWTQCKAAWAKIIECLSGNYCSGLQIRIAKLYRELQEQKLAKIEQLSTCTPARSKALKQTHANAMRRTVRSIAVDHQVLTCAAMYGIAQEDLMSGSMNAYEYQLHTEFVDQLTELTHLTNRYHVVKNTNLFIDALGEGIALGIEANKHQELVIATQWADFGWEILEIVKGIGEGLVLGVKNAAHFIKDATCHPIRTVQDIAYGLGTLIRATGTIIGMSIHHETLCLMGQYEQSYKNTQKIYEELQQISQACLTQLAEMPRRDIAKHATACATDWVLVGKALTFAHSICSRAGPLLVEVLEILSKEPVVECAVAGAEGMLFEMSETAKHVGGAARGVIKDSRVVLETFHAEFMAQLVPEIAELRHLFANFRKGFAECTNQYIKIPYEHILGFDLHFTRRGLPDIGGCHHDLMRSMERRNVLQFVNKIMCKNGFYKADIFYEGVKVKEGVTFFPSDWPREKVIRNIYEAYDDFIAKGARYEVEKGGKYIAKGFIKEGLEIEMYISKNGKMATAYPILK